MGAYGSLCAVLPAASFSPGCDAWNMIHISASSALVLLWIRDNRVYSSVGSRNYLAEVRLDEGKFLYEKCNAVWPHYHKVIEYRKLGIGTCLDRMLSESSGCQILILAAGFSPLGLDLYYKHRDKDLRIFETDIRYLPEKEKLIRSLDAKAADSIRFVAGDITLEKTFADIKRAGWDAKLPSVLVMEGISYYLKEADVQKVLHRFCSLCQGKKQVLLEYLLPGRDIHPSRRAIPTEVFHIISHSTGLGQPTRLNKKRITALLPGEVTEHLSLHQLEKIFGSGGAAFPRPDDGWIEVIALQPSS